MKTETKVACHAGHSYPQQPLSFEWEGERLTVEKLVAEWRQPEGKLYRVQTKDEAVFELCYSPVDDVWLIEKIR